MRGSVSCIRGWQRLQAHCLNTAVKKHSCHLPVSMLQQVCIIRSHLLDIQARWQHAICTNAVQTAALLPSDCLYIHQPPMTQHEDAGTSSLFCNHVLYMLLRVIGVLGKNCVCAAGVHYAGAAGWTQDAEMAVNMCCTCYFCRATACLCL